LSRQQSNWSGSLDGNAGDTVIRSSGWTQAVSDGTNGNGTIRFDDASGSDKDLNRSPRHSGSCRFMPPLTTHSMSAVGLVTLSSVAAVREGRRAIIGPNVVTHRRIVSYDTSMPRSASRSSTSR
jgi:hypothetical protein